MLSRRRAAASIASVLLSAGTSHANAAQAARLEPSPLFAAYQRFCLAPAGDPTQALALATKAGWIAPAADDRLPLGALSMTDAQQRESGRAGERLRLSVGRAADPAGLGLRPAPWRVCIVISETVDAAAAAAVAAWAGVPPAQGSSTSEGGAALFVITLSPNGARRSAAGLSDAQIQALVDRRQIIAVGSNISGPNTVLLYAAPAP